MTAGVQETDQSRSWGNRVGIRSRILVAIGLSALTTIGVGTVGVNQMGALREQISIVYQDGAVGIRQIGDLRGQWWEFQTFSARTAIPGSTPEILARDTKRRDELGGLVPEVTADLLETDLAPGALTALEGYLKHTNEYSAIQGQLFAAFAAGEPDALATYVPPLVVAEQAALAAIDQALAEQTTYAQESQTRAAAAYERARSRILIVGGIGILLALLLALAVARGVMRPLVAIQEVLRRIGHGDLSARVEQPGPAELGDVARTLNSSMETIKGVFSLAAGTGSQLAESARSLQGAASAIAATTADTVQRADEVSRQAGGVAASVDAVETSSAQMDNAIREIASTASQASEVASQAVAVAGETSGTIVKLGESSREIASFMSLINTIAEQTNLLALNATIEAARAGDAGKGFAVVATEVKELAQQTARATEDISRLVQAIEQGTTSASSAIDDVSEVIRRIQDYQHTVASAVEEQSAATEEMRRSLTEAATGSRSIAENISDLASGTQQNTIRTNETAVAASEMTRMSAELQKALSQFQL